MKKEESVTGKSAKRSWKGVLEVNIRMNEMRMKARKELEEWEEKV